MKKLILVILALILCGGPSLAQRVPGLAETAARGVPVTGNTETLLKAYSRWKDSTVGDEPVLVFGLTPIELLSHSSEAAGQASVHLIDGTVTIDMGDHSGPALDAWLMFDPPSGSPASGIQRLGSVTAGHNPSRSRLHARLDMKELGESELSAVVLTRRDRTPEEGVLYRGSPSLFQRLYSAELSQETLTRTVRGGAPLSSPTLQLKHLGGGGTIEELLEQLVASGESLFFEEQFGGNGRTCGTCHPAANNFTLDPAFISLLPPDDPLFVSETNPDLAELEDDLLLRQEALILENVDTRNEHSNPHACPEGEDRFVLRSVQQLQGLARTIATGTSPPGPLANVTGWSGGGSPLGLAVTLGDGTGHTTNGSLRDFAIGAIIQHFPKTMDRVAGVDFRLPTSSELDALVLFQLSLGRAEDFDLQTLALASANAEAGKASFQNNPNGISCSNCHGNAGALIESIDCGCIENPNRRVGTELRKQRESAIARPPDGGLGTDNCGTGSHIITALGPCASIPFTSPPECQLGGAGLPTDDCFILDSGSCAIELAGSFGDLTFNVPSIVEAADTAPFFHNNVDATLKDAIRHYATPEFAELSFGESTNFDDQQVEDVDRFLRVLNSVDNIETSAAPPLEKALDIFESASGPFLPEDPATFLQVARLHVNQTIEVLEDIHDNEPLDPSGPTAEDDAICFLEEAVDNINIALQPLLAPVRHAAAIRACKRLECARNGMVTSDTWDCDEGAPPISCPPCP